MSINFNEHVLGVGPNGELPPHVFDQLTIPDANERAAMQAILDDYQTGQDATDTAVASVVSTGPQTEAALTGVVQDKQSRARAIFPLRVPTYDNKPGVGHPDVLRVPGGWNGYEYWMAYTPLPGTFRELPEVAVSHDGVHWQTPPGGASPLFDIDDAAAMGYEYWADTELALSHDGTTMFLYFKGTTAGTTNEYVVTTSTDGLNWSAPSVTIPNAQAPVVSPAVVTEAGGGFTMFEMNSPNIQRRTSTDGLAWSAATVGTCPTLPAPYTPWHVDVVRSGGVYHALVQATTSNSRTNPFRLFYWTSTDGLTWAGSTSPAVPLTGTRFDKMGAYRSTLQPAASGLPGRFDVWVNMIDDTRTSNHTAAVWRIGLFRDFDLTGDAASPAPSGATPADDEVWYGADRMVPHTGTPALAVVGNAVGWGIKVDDRVTVITKLPPEWSRFTVEALLLNPTTNGGDVVLQGLLSMPSPDTPVDAGFPLSILPNSMPPVAGGTMWVTVYDGSLSAFDVQSGDASVVLTVRRRGGPANTYGTVDVPVLLALRFRRKSPS